MARPEGRRCLVRASNGRTTSHLKNGGTLHQFTSCLPGGASDADGLSVLDCIFHESDSTYYIMDVLCWKGVWLMECEASFRLQWIQMKLAESNTMQTDTDSPYLSPRGFSLSELRQEWCS